MAPLMAVTGGWDHDSSTIYLAELAKLEDPEALTAVIQRLVENWTSEWRPPLAEILTAYRFETRRREMERNRPEIEGPRCDFIHGVEAARRAYEHECHRQNREPNWDHFDSMFERSLAAAIERSGETTT